MSQQAETQRTARQTWAAPGGSHDRLIQFLKAALPMMVGAVSSLLAVAPFAMNGEVSFVLDKNDVDVAGERMRVREALYRGQDSKGRPFSLRAGSAVQKTSHEPIVEMQDLSARLLMADGPAFINARNGRYNLDSERVGIVGPVQFVSAGGYRLTTSNVGIDLRTRRMQSAGRVDGRMPVGTFGADQLKADLGTRVIVLNGHARLRIEQNAIKGRAR
jgi:lipopolysaccharide export system protein LptC